MSARVATEYVSERVSECKGWGEGEDAWDRLVLTRLKHMHCLPSLLTALGGRWSTVPALIPSSSESTGVETVHFWCMRTMGSRLHTCRHTTKAPLSRWSGMSPPPRCMWGREKARLWACWIDVASGLSWCRQVMARDWSQRKMPMQLLRIMVVQWM